MTATVTNSLRSVLVPLDLTPSSDRVLGRLVLLPLADDAEVTLLHVVPRDLRPQEQRRAERDAARALGVEARRLRQALPASISITPVVRTGGAAKEIRACATGVRAELIVLGRSRGRPLRDALLGTTAERIIRQARRPVLVVRLPPRRPYARPMLALDLDRAAHAVVPVLLSLVPPPRPRIVVIHAFDFPHHARTYPSLSEADATRQSDLRLGATAKLKRLLDAAQREAEVPPADAPPWKLLVRQGQARAIVQRAMRRIDPDLLALGTRTRTTAAHLFLGTVAGDLLRRARGDVLLVPPADQPSR